MLRRRQVEGHGADLNRRPARQLVLYRLPQLPALFRELDAAGVGELRGDDVTRRMCLAGLVLAIGEMLFRRGGAVLDFGGCHTGRERRRGVELGGLGGERRAREQQREEKGADLHMVRNGGSISSVRKKKVA